MVELACGSASRRGACRKPGWPAGSALSPSKECREVVTSACASASQSSTLTLASLHTRYVGAGHAHMLGAASHLSHAMLDRVRA